MTVMVNDVSVISDRMTDAVITLEDILEKYPDVLREIGYYDKLKEYVRYFFDVSDYIYDLIDF